MSTPAGIESLLPPPCAALAAAATGDLAAFDDVAKVDTTNALQLELMHSLLSHNMAAINFWLSYCVLGAETKQYPQRLSASAWHVADNTRGQVVGFSGTNDNHRLLPLQVGSYWHGAPHSRCHVLLLLPLTAACPYKHKHTHKHKHTTP